MFLDRDKENTDEDKEADTIKELHNSVPLIGDDAPGFTAESTAGTIHFPADYHGKWVVLFSHPADFTPVCTSELATFAALADEFRELNAELLGVSVDSVSSHLAWIKNIQDKIKYKAYNGQKFTFPIIADVKMNVAKKYGMIQPNSSDTKAVRAVFMVDPKGKVRAILYYPLSTGRNFEEIKRLLKALQTTDEHGVSTPADWQPGEEVLVAAPATMEEMTKRVEDDVKKLDCEDWFFCRKKVA